MGDNQQDQKGSNVIEMLRGYDREDRQRTLGNIQNSESVTMFPHPMAIKQIWQMELGWDYERDVEELVVDEGIALGQAWHDEPGNSYMQYIMLGSDPRDWFSDEESYIAIRHGNRWLCRHELWDWPDLEAELFRLIDERLTRDAHLSGKPRPLSY